MRARPLPIDPLTAPPDVTLVLPGSKSITNRALVAAALADGTSTLGHILVAEDTLAMIDCLGLLGVDISYNEANGTATVVGSGGRLAATDTLWVRQSGTTARFMLPLAAMATGGATVDGHSQIRERPQGDLVEALVSLGARAEPLGAVGSLPMRLHESALSGGPVQVPGDVSSQFMSALLLSAPAMDQGLTIELVGDIVSAPYVSMTVAVMRAFGADIVVTDDRRYEVAPVNYQARHFEIEPDASAASYFFAAAAVSRGRVTVDGLGTGSLQGDLSFVDVLARMGAKVDKTPQSTTVSGTGAIAGVDISMADLSDTALTLAAVAPLATSTVRATGIGFIREKESDRIGAIVTELRRLGADADEEPDGFVVRPAMPTGGIVESYDDHRIAMAFTVLGLVTPGIEISDPQCVAKTFPEYFDTVDLLRAVGDADLAILAIDGPAGSGKSTVARRAAEQMGLQYLDTGAMYRSITHAALEQQVALDDQALVASLARHIEIDVALDAVFIDGADVTEAIRTEAVNNNVSQVAANPGVRSAMRRQQRAWARRRGGGVLEGRDIGSVVFPSARLKVYVTASIEERARRRASESGQPVDEVIAALQERDRLDSSRADSPLTEAAGAVTIDTTGCTIDQVVDQVVELFDE